MFAGECGRGDQIGECQFNLLAMSNRLHGYNRIDEALCLQIIHSIFNEGLSSTDTSRNYGYPYKTIMSIA